MDTDDETKDTDVTARCRYCGKLRNISDLKPAIVYENGWQVEKMYCADDDCAQCADMAAQG